MSDFRKLLQTVKDLSEAAKEKDWSKYDEPTISRIAKGITKPVDRTDYDVAPGEREKLAKTGPERRKQSLIKQGMLKAKPSSKK